MCDLLRVIRARSSRTSRIMLEPRRTTLRHVARVSSFITPTITTPAPQINQWSLRAVIFLVTFSQCSTKRLVITQFNYLTKSISSNDAILSEIMVSPSRVFQPRPAAWVARVGDTTSRTLDHTSRRVVAVACSSLPTISSQSQPSSQPRRRLAI